MSARILIAEDDKKQAELIRLYLEREGHATVVVHDGRAALEEARHRRPDLLVLDVMMPEVDGLDVCRAHRLDSDVPIVLLTARSTEDDLLVGLDIGADDYPSKPPGACESRSSLTDQLQVILTGPCDLGRLQGVVDAGWLETLR